jgi:hypothetical protein
VCSQARAAALGCLEAGRRLTWTGTMRLNQRLPRFLAGVTSPHRTFVIDLHQDRSNRAGHRALISRPGPGGAFDPSHQTDHADDTIHDKIRLNTVTGAQVFPHLRLANNRVNRRLPLSPVDDLTGFACALRCGPRSGRARSSRRAIPRPRATSVLGTWLVRTVTHAALADVREREAMTFKSRIGGRRHNRKSLPRLG